MNPEVVAATLRNTRWVTFALWWKVCAFLATSTLVLNFAIGFAAYVLPFGQLHFALASVAKAAFGNAFAASILATPDAIPIAFSLLIDAVVLTLLFMLMNWLLARHVGRDVGGFRLVLERVR